MIGLRLVVMMEDESEEESECGDDGFTGEEFGDGERNDDKTIDDGEEGSESEDNTEDSGEDGSVA
jgi:hypothetical protein